MLSLSVPSNYVRQDRIIPDVDGTDDFGTALRAFRIRSGGKLPKIARLALGLDATKKKVRDTANYFARIERNEVPGVGLEQLQLLAKGYGFSLLSDFFAQIERRSQSTVLKTPARPDEDRPHPEVDHGAEIPAAASQAALAELVGFIDAYTIELITAARRAAARAREKAHRPLPSARPRRARPRKSAR